MPVDPVHPNDQESGVWLYTPPPSGGSEPSETSGSSGTDQSLPDFPTDTNSEPSPDTDRFPSESPTDRCPERSVGGSTEWDSSPTAPCEVGQVLFEKYRLLELLGEGGMGQVWLVENLALDRKSALKLIRPRVAQNDRGWKRFRREAQLMGKINHPNAVVVYDFNRAPPTAYIEMEYVRGKSLDKVLAEQKGEPLPLGVVVAIVDQLCSVLQEAHSHKDEETGQSKPIIHRDLKPSNLILDSRKPQGQNLKVLDFGIAKMIVDDEQDDTQLTNAGEFLGTVEYCSPEQIRGGGGKSHGKQGGRQAIEGASDLYSTGVLLYQLLTGVHPFRGDKMGILARHLTEPPRPMKEANPSAAVPPAVESVVRWCLEKKPEDRPKDARELADRFRAAAAQSVTHQRRGWLAPLVAVHAVGLIFAVGLLRWKDWRKARAKLPAVVMTKPVGTQPPPGPDETPASRAQTGYRPGASPKGAPARLVRERDGVEFERSPAGVYLPVGYEPEDPNDRIGDWPRVLVRSSDHTRFIRLRGKVFLMGDDRLGPNGAPSATEAEALTPHWVRVSDFYIQETEVTNAEVSKYLEQFVEAAPELTEWKRIYDLIRESSPGNVDRRPAVGISHPRASMIARYYHGRLPTEAEWEFAAKSTNDHALWSWGAKPPPPGGKPFTRVFNPADDPFPAPSVVKAFENDRTDQGVHDLTGNVREWCADIYRPYKDMIPAGNSSDNPTRDPADLVETADLTLAHVLRGGSFYKDLSQSMVFLRDKADPGPELSDVGFRVVLECPESVDTGGGPGKGVGPN